MRTTLTLDPDVAAELKQLAEELGIGWKEAVNTVLRDGLSIARAPRPPPPPFRTTVWDGGEVLIPGVDCVQDMLDLAEGDDRR